MTTTCFRRLSTVLLLALLTTLTPFLARPAAAGVDRWTPIGPEGGEILSLAADPDSPGTFYVGALYGGVWKSVDGGGSWAPTVEGVGGISVSLLAVSAGRILAGGYDGAGLYALTEGASAWRPVGPSPFGVYDLAVDPADPMKIWTAGALIGGDLFASVDAGESWGRKLSLQYPLYSVAVASTVPSTVYAGGSDGLYTSRDGGASWHEFDIGLTGPPWSAPYAVGEIRVDPENPETVYVGTNLGLWRTMDAGAHWSLLADGEPRYRVLSLPEALLGLNGNNQLLRSEDQGDTWEPVERQLWSEVTFLEADPTEPGGAWLGSRRHLFRTSDSGRTWTQLPGRDLRATSIGALAFDPFRPGILYTTVTSFSSTGKLQRSVDGGASWSPTLPALDVSSIAADPRRPGHLYVATPKGVAISRDRGAHWRRLLREPLGIEAVAVDPHRAGTLWAAGRRFWRSRDAGRTWKLLASSIGPDGAQAARIFPSPWHPDTLYLTDSNGYLRRSTDGGVTWEILYGVDAFALAFDPAQQDVLYAAGGTGIVRKSLDGGTTWEPLGQVTVTGGDGVSALLVDRLDPSILYAGTTSQGVWRSLDRGATWQPLSAGFITPRVTCLEADPRNPRRLVACTMGGGLLEIQISPGS